MWFLLLEIKVGRYMDITGIKRNQNKNKVAKFQPNSLEIGTKTIAIPIGMMIVPSKISTLLFFIVLYYSVNFIFLVIQKKSLSMPYSNLAINCHKDSAAITKEEGHRIIDGLPIRYNYYFCRIALKAMEAPTSEILC